jgi:hypothetical protein
MLVGFAASSSREKRDLFTLRQAPRILYKPVVGKQKNEKINLNIIYSRHFSKWI